MRIFSYQNPIILEEIENTGVYAPFLLREKNDFLKDCINDPHGFIQSYDWLHKKMIERKIKSIGEAKEIIWGWGQNNSDNAINLRYKRNREVYNNHVLLELEIDEDRLCPSCYYNWHSILNNGPIVHTEEEYDKADTQEKIEATWDNVFDVFFDKDIEPCIQYTFFQILKTDIISIKKIENMKVVK